jgi:DNA-binding NarL/FixJ family response regulator
MFRTWESTVLLRQGTEKSGDGGVSGGEGASSSSSGAAAEEDNAPSETATTSDSSSGGGSSGSNTDDTDASALPSLVRLKRQTVIGISANAESADVEAAKRAGVDHFLSKPVKVAQIVEYIRAIK